MGEAILGVVMDSLAPFDDPDICGACAGLDGFVAHADPTLPFNMVTGAFVTVHLRQFGPTSTSQSGSARNAIPGAYPLDMEASWSIELREACYPGVEEVADQPVFPTAERLHEVNRHLTAHGYTAYTALYAAWRAGTLFPAATQCPNLRFGALTPIPPQAYMAGWTFDVTGEVP